MKITKYFSDGRPKEIRKSVNELSDEECAKFCYNHLETVSKHSGIKLDLLRKMPGKSQMKVLINFFSDNFSRSYINSIVGEYLHNDIVTEIASFLNIEKSVIDNLDEEKQSAVIGHYIMTIQDLSDEQIRTDLNDIMTIGKLRSDIDVESSSE